MTPPAAKRPLRPRDAATLVVVDASASRPRILMGRRRADLAFMPNKFVFPGGRSETADRVAPALGELPAVECERLLYDMKGRPSPARARGLAMAAIRETFEETGHLIGMPSPDAPAQPPTIPAQAAPVSPRDATAPPAPWQRFLEQGVVPHLTALRFFARAITPPGRPRRFDTRFFLAEARSVAKVVPPPDAELSEIGWHDLDEVRALDLPNITRAVVEDLSDMLDKGLDATRRTPVPYYFFRKGAFERILIDAPDEIG